jgi:hypothetical protein
MPEEVRDSSVGTISPGGHGDRSTASSISAV